MTAIIKYRQYLLQQDRTFQVCWLPNTHDVKVGNVVKLKKVEGEWQVKHIWQTVVSMPPDTSWRVGGLE